MRPLTMCGEIAGDELSSVAASVWILRTHELGLIAGGEASDAIYNGVVVRPHEASEPSFHGFRAFRRVSGDQDVQTERRRLFLEAARVADDRPGPAEQIYEVGILQRRQQPDIFRPIETIEDLGMHLGVAMSRKRYHFVAILAETAQRAKRHSQGLANVLTPVKGGKDELFVRRQRGHSRFERLVTIPHLLQHIQQRVDAGIAGDNDLLQGNAFAQEVIPRDCRRRKVPRR